MGLDMKYFIFIIPPSIFHIDMWYYYKYNYSYVLNVIKNNKK